MKRIITFVLAILLVFTITACSSAPQPAASPTEAPTASPTPEPTPTPTPEPTPEPTPTPMPEPEYRKIGVEDEQTYVVLIKNNVGQDIIGISIKDSDDKEYPDNLVPESQSVKQDETVQLFYGNIARSYRPLVDMRLTFADESVAELYNFEYYDYDVIVAELCFEDGVAFVKYMNEAGEEVNTKDAQLEATKKKEEQAAPKKTPKPTKKPKKKPSQNVDDCLDDNIAWN